MLTERVSFETGAKRAIVDLTSTISRFVGNKGDGLLNVSVPHATAGLVIMELGSGSEQDLWSRLDELLPRGARYRHAHGSPGHGADHLLPAFLAPSLTLPVIKGKACLGTWQSVALVDPNVDNPDRQVLLVFVPDGS